MTGEITLRGEVLPIGGLKEKLWLHKEVASNRSYSSGERKRS